MKKLRITLAVLGIALLIVFVYAEYLGTFSNVKVEDKEEGGYKVVGLKFTGAYSKAGKFMSEVDKKLMDNNITVSRGFGIYYDDPKITSEENCRSYIGGILEEKDYNKISELKSAGLVVDSIPKANALVANFPLKSTLSYMIGPMKVYPEIAKSMKEKGYTSTLSLEIYDSANENIMFVMQYQIKNKY